MARRAWLVEADMAAPAYAQDLQIDPPCPPDHLLIAGAIIVGVLEGDGAVGNVNIAGRDIDVLEEGLVHPQIVAVGVLLAHGVILVEVKGDDARKVEARVLVQANQLAVEADRCRSRASASWRRRSVARRLPAGPPGRRL